MKQFVNKNRIIEAYILKPYRSNGEVWDAPSHDWQLVLVLGYYPDGNSIKMIIEKSSESHCIKIIEELGLNFVNEIN